MQTAAADSNANNNTDSTGEGKHQGMSEMRITAGGLVGTLGGGSVMRIAAWWTYQDFGGSVMRLSC